MRIKHYLHAANSCIQLYYICTSIVVMSIQNTAFTPAIKTVPSQSWKSTLGENVHSASQRP